MLDDSSFIMGGMSIADFIRNDLEYLVTINRPSFTHNLCMIIVFPTWAMALKASLVEYNDATLVLSMQMYSVVRPLFGTTPLISILTLVLRLTPFIFRSTSLDIWKYIIASN